MVRNVFFKYVRTYKWSACFFIFFGCFWAFTLPYMSYLLGEIIDELKHTSLESTNLNKIAMLLAGIYISIHVLRSMGYFGNGLFSLRSVPKFKQILATELFEHVGEQSIEYFSKTQPGLIAQKISNVSMCLNTIVFTLFSMIYPQSLAIIITGVMLSIVVPYYGLALWLWGGVMIVYAYTAAKTSRKNSQKFAESCAEYNGLMVDTLNNIHSVINNYTIDKESKSLATSLEKLSSDERVRDYHASKVMLTQHLAMNTLVGFYLVSSIVGYSNGILTIGEIVFVMTSVSAISGLASSLGNTFLQLLFNVGLLEDGLSLLNLDHKVPESKAAENIIISEGKIFFDSISFSYPAGRDVYKDFSLTINGKQKVGVVGRSGCGKSTLLSLIMRLYDVDGGVINIDGTNIKSYSKMSLREQISLVPQNLIMFDRTIYDNIAYGCQDVTFEDVESAAKRAYCHDFIVQNPEGYNTLVGSNGIKLSGGQRQRIAIARAILKNAPILLLDEATSALDSETEELIQCGINELIKDKTAIIVAHRLSTLREVDLIIVMDDGKIVQTGTHEELISIEGLYKELWQHQSRGGISSF